MHTAFRLPERPAPFRRGDLHPPDLERDGDTRGRPRGRATAIPFGNFEAPFPDGSGDGLLPGPNDGPDGPIFRIPANVVDHLETVRITLGPELPELRIYGAAAHMHYVGTDLKVELERNGERECLLQET
ncbi:hypothetical protein [Chondromyces crocatus]|uniref:hypothetical protein n=1 Tax=Chondromyces crocatus TaxID=52 RepID=UPI00067B986E|nr:hypothetical protein [Chondromyces crocatus]